MWSFGIRVTQRCGADRPAFVLEDSNRRFWFYAACGMLPDQSPRHQTLRGICSNVHAAASLLHAAVSSMGAFVLRANFVSHDPDSPASVTAHEKLLTALRDLGLELQPAAPPMDLVSQC